MSLVLGILSDFLKSTQPGIQAAEARVKFLTLAENLVFRKTELIVNPSSRCRSDLKSSLSQDLDQYGENRTVEHEGTVGRKEKTESFSRDRWLDNSAKLLDHYCTCLLSSSAFILMVGFSPPHGRADSKGPWKGNRDEEVLCKLPRMPASGFLHQTTGD